MLDLTGLSLDDVERIVILRAIDGAGGNMPLAAARLGVSPSTLYRKRERWHETVQVEGASRSG
jgi:two-component system repressor protein LuxO